MSKNRYLLGYKYIDITFTNEYLRIKNSFIYSETVNNEYIGRIYQMSS